MNGKIILSEVILMTLVAPFFYTGYPIVIHENQNEVIALGRAEKENVNPLASCDFSKGINCVYLLFSKEDREQLPNGMMKRKLFECKDNQTLELLRSNFQFHKSGGDMATCESKIYVYKDGALVFHSAIVLTDSLVGLQNGSTGWAEAVKSEILKELFLTFRAVNRPIAIL